MEFRKSKTVRLTLVANFSGLNNCSLFKMYKVVVRSKCFVPQIKHLRLLSASGPKPDEPLFPPKEDFPSRHIGPRDKDIISMLDSLGFKVSMKSKQFYYHDV